MKKLAVIAFILLNTIGSFAQDKVQAIVTQKPTVSHWKFKNYSDKTLNKSLVNKATLNLTKLGNGKWEYSGQCFVNNYNGGFITKSKTNEIVKKTGGATTLMAGLDEKLNAAEYKYNQSLENAKSFKIQKNLLLIYLNAAKTKYMVFVPQS